MCGLFTRWLEGRQGSHCPRLDRILAHFISGFQAEALDIKKIKIVKKNKQMLSPSRAEEVGGGRMAAKPSEGASVASCRGEGVDGMSSSR